MTETRLRSFIAYLHATFPGHSATPHETDSGYAFRLVTPDGRPVAILTVSTEFLDDTPDVARTLGPGGVDLEGAIRHAPPGARVHVTSAHGIEYAMYKLGLRAKGSTAWKTVTEAMFRHEGDGGPEMAPRTRSEVDGWLEVMHFASTIEVGLFNLAHHTREPLNLES